MVRVESLFDCLVNAHASQVISVNVMGHVVWGLQQFSTFHRLYSSRRTIDACMTIFSDGNETEKQAMFIAILWLENYQRHSAWEIADCQEEWDLKVSELLDRLFR